MCLIRGAVHCEAFAALQSGLYITMIHSVSSEMNVVSELNATSDKIFDEVRSVKKH